MKSIFYIIAILAIFGSSWFSYSSLGKIKKKSAFVEEQRKKLRDLKASLAEVDSKMMDAQKALDGIKKEEAELEASVEIVESKRRQKTQRLNKIESRIAELDGRLEEVVELKKQFGENAGEVSLEEIPDKIKEMKREVSSAEERSSELETLIEGSQSSLTKLQEETNRFNVARKARSNRIKTNSKEAVVTAVNNRWGFAVLNLGSNQGFQPTSDLLVKRGARLIGRLKVASIEPSQTIANFDRGSIASGVRIRPGDRVIVQVPASK